MPWFSCDDCGNSIKKPKLVNHMQICSASSFTCLDCSTTFNQTDVQRHTRCVTEKEKYQEGATKPGGYASTGFKSEENPSIDDGMVGIEYITTSPPWKCRACNRSFASQLDAMNHTRGQKHRNNVAKMNNQEMAKDEKSIEKDKNEEKKMSSKKRTKLQIKFGLEILKERKKNKIGLKRFKKHFLRKCKATEHPGDLFDGAVNTLLQTSGVVLSKKILVLKQIDEKLSSKNVKTT